MIVHDAGGADVDAATGVAHENHAYVICAAFESKRSITLYVMGPAMPSATSPFDAWNVVTFDLVCGP
jgi:hypothetical protein